MELEKKTDDLFVTFKVKEQTYAFNANYVDSIFELKEELTPVPRSRDCMKGVISVRGYLLPMIDLRKMLDVPSLEQEQTEFVKMLYDRQQDHIHWVDQLKRSVEENTPFTLATDHHKCAFGKWYDHYTSPNHSVMMAMKKIDNPHQIIHQSARDCMACHGDKDKQREIIERISIPAMNSVLGGIDAMINEFSSSWKKMCIVLCCEEEKLGIMVDEVLSVERLEDVQPLDAVLDNELVSHCGTSKSGARILLIESSRIFEKPRKAVPPQTAAGA